MRKWKVDDSIELYNINSWGKDYFSVNDKGNIVVRPKEGGPEIDLRNLIDELQLHDISLPLLLRFPDILNNRISKISKCFDRAAKEYDYKAESYIVYPIKVNQMRPVVEELISHGNNYQYHASCSGDLWVDVLPGWSIVRDQSLDTRVVRHGYAPAPFILMGWDVRPEIIHTPIKIGHIAPTLTHFMRIRAPNASSLPPLADIRK